MCTPLRNLTGEAINFMKLLGLSEDGKNIGIKHSGD